MRAALAMLLAAAPLDAAIEGVVVNGTTGRPQSGVAVTLVKLEQGMVPVGTTRSEAGGKFRFSEDAGDLMLRAEFDGVTYNHRITPGARMGDIRVNVYASEAPTVSAGSPDQHVLLIEPNGNQMVVNESFLFRNESRPPVTYADPKRGTLRFYLPPAAKEVVQVQATGPAAMPIRSSAEKTGEPNVYRVSFPIKPGESRIDLTYLVPYQANMEFVVRTLYPGVVARLAAPSGVTITGDGLRSMGQEPQTQAAVFDLGSSGQARLTISGEGRLARSEGSEGGGEEISVTAPAVRKQLWMILGFAAAILGLGFYGLYTAGAARDARPRRTRKS